MQGQLLKILLVISVLLTLMGCETLRFYSQAVTGQSALMLKRQPVGQLMAETGDPALRDRLELVQEILVFSEQQGLRAGGAFDTYVETGQPSVIWNVFAADPLSLSLHTWCFPVAGCVTYRGYFKQSDAERYAEVLRARGLDVFVGGVAAYSTLGWFRDPLLDTFLFRDDAELAGLIFHELAHQIVYVKGDTRFNESLATTVERYLLALWLAERERPQVYEHYLASRERRQQVITLINGTRDALSALYASDIPVSEKLVQKSLLFQAMVKDYNQLASSWPTGDEFGRWMQAEMNNARIETVADYNQWVPAMAPWLAAEGLEQFAIDMAYLATLPAAQREAMLISGQRNSR